MQRKETEKSGKTVLNRKDKYVEIIKIEYQGQKTQKDKQQGEYETQIKFVIAPIWRKDYCESVEVRMREEEKGGNEICDQCDKIGQFIALWATF